ncbi:serine/threonine protein kinase [Actinomadura xylanilytica]|uniref:serine/threonine protein kinase n=1 Tax=Actinomadura xylanilytica TaxID=887459 RepID=UPI00255AC3D3|nr:serine/threonine-protein kinase [Actinomadura xylanilytica]MDL4773810.1 serine/threonine-protein kinase [Actinomadura xylanilytica]
MPEALPLQPGDPRRLGSYEIAGRLGVGEQGAVFLGRGPAGRDVAVKLLHVRLSGEPVARSRFTGAFAPARRVSGFCTAAILEAEVEGDRAYVVSECVDGPSLQQLVDDEGPRGGAVVERLAVGTAIALAAVHRAGAVHHDFKPGNVLLGRDGPRVCDFGIAPALDAVNAGPSGNVTDDPAYKAPEQLSGMGVGPAADVFAWAATMLFAAAGKPPFGQDSPSEVMQRIVYDDADLSTLPESLREVVTDALAKDPAERPTAKLVLERLLDEDGELAPRIPPTMLTEGRALAKSSTPQPDPPAPPPVPPTPAPSSQPAPSAPSAQPAPPAAAPVPALQAPAISGPMLPAPVTAPTPIPAPIPAPQSQARPNQPALAPAALRNGAVPSHDPDAGAADPTAAFQAIDPNGPAPLYEPPASPADRTEPTPHLIPGLEPGQGDDGRHSTAILAMPTKFSRPSNHVLGVALSLIIGVGVGIAIISLVLWPLKGGDDKPPSGPAVADDQPVTSIPESFSGTWKGTAVNAINNVSFPIEVTFQEGSTTAHAVYPKEKCNGTLKLTRGTGKQLEMSLTVPRPCTSGNVQVTRQPDGTLQYAWSSPQNQRGYAGKLSRN